MSYRRFIGILFLLVVPLFTACNNNSESAPTVAVTAVLPSNPTVALNSPTQVAIVTSVPPTETAVPPSPTPSLAALVNDNPIYLFEYEQELARYEQAVQLNGTPTAEPINYGAIVLDALIERSLITQAATAQGIAVTEEEVDAKLVELQQAAGESGNFTAWLEANLLTVEEFRQALTYEMLTERMATLVTANVPFNIEQVHARYIQVDDAALAQSLLDQINSGSDFALLAAQYSLDQATAPNGGDLGYFGRGWLLVPEVETAAFALQPGETSPVLPVTNSETGQTTYYLIQMIAREAERPLDADMRFALLDQTFQNWLQSLWNEAEIIRFVETGT